VTKRLSSKDAYSFSDLNISIVCQDRLGTNIRNTH
jgi:hypothetical protein